MIIYFESFYHNNYFKYCICKLMLIDCMFSKCMIGCSFVAFLLLTCSLQHILF